MTKAPKKTIPRDISWLSFNARVLQEAADPTVPLKERIRFLGIFSNNLDEFFRVRVAALKRMISLGKKARMHLEQSPQKILDSIQLIVLEQQSEFNRIWNLILQEMKREKIIIKTEKDLTRDQQKFVTTFFEEEVRSNVNPLMIENIQEFPYMREKSIYLAVVMSRKNSAYKRKYSLIEVPTRAVSRFIQLPSSRPGEHQIILLEDIIRFNLPQIFAFFEYEKFSAHIIKFTKDAEFDIDYDEALSLTAKIERGLKNRRRGKPVRFTYDKEIDPALLEYLIRRSGLTKKDHLIPGGRIHNFRHFMDFPSAVFRGKQNRRKPFMQQDLSNTTRVTDVILKKDVLLSFPYHSFNPIIDLLRESAMDPDVTMIKITAYRLASQSKVVNALINAARNGKQVIVVLELRARFDEENNLEWKEILELEGVKVVTGVPDLKVHAKICLIRKRKNNQTIHYGFVSTGNLNEKTSTVYCDHCLLTANKNIMADVNRIFNYLENHTTGAKYLKMCNTLLISPTNMRKELLKNIQAEIKAARSKKKASITVKLNSLSDDILIFKLYEAATAGVEVKMIIRGICCALTQNKKFKVAMRAISIVDEYLEHARVLIFHNQGKEKVIISSSDWMVRNLDHRVEAAVVIQQPAIAKELREIIEIQLKDNVKARILDNHQNNKYVKAVGKKIRSQVEIYQYLLKKTTAPAQVVTQD
ncbi:polyphosphate kinase 1 [Pollutibacter soli]|uniref:polyphosphate kinase 1 n=1 Tax=Pollutibacter soli TaxID=3034157 RepID=UPI003013C791